MENKLYSFKYKEGKRSALDWSHLVTAKSEREAVKSIVKYTLPYVGDTLKTRYQRIKSLMRWVKEEFTIQEHRVYVSKNVIENALFNGI